MKIMITYKFITPNEILSKSNIEEINSLYKQLATNTHFISEEAIRRAADKSYVVLAYDADKIIGIGTLCVMYTPKFILGHLEQIIVDTEYRGKGIGRKISQIRINKAKELGVQNLSLTTNKNRIESNELYKSLGFELWETNVYRMKL